MGCETKALGVIRQNISPELRDRYFIYRTASEMLNAIREHSIALRCMFVHTILRLVHQRPCKPVEQSVEAAVSKDKHIAWQHGHVARRLGTKQKKTPVACKFSAANCKGSIRKWGDEVIDSPEDGWPHTERA